MISHSCYSTWPSKQQLLVKLATPHLAAVPSQVISLLKNAWEKAGLDLYLAPYGVLPTSYECGIIEVVPNTDSRSALGDTADGGLAEIWRREFGAPGTARHEAARLNFIRSAAG